MRDAAEIARLSADAMWADDKASRAMGMKVEQVGPGFSVLSMPVTETMTNGHGFCHGGYIFSLADSAFAFACNSRNQRHVAQTFERIGTGKIRRINTHTDRRNRNRLARIGRGRRARVVPGATHS